MKAKDFVNEKWTEKYKKSINCQNPKGFSQKAHCAGRKKNEDATATMPDVDIPDITKEPGILKKGAKKLGKILGKGLGALDFVDAAHKFSKGDVAGGAESTLSGITYAVPVVGLPLGLAKDFAKDAGYDPLDVSSKSYPKDEKGRPIYQITPFESKSNVLKGIVVAENNQFGQMIKNITSQNPKGSAAEKILLGKFLGSDQGTYARNVLGKNHKGWVDHITWWLKMYQPKLQKEFTEVDFSDLESLAYDMYENYLAKQGQLGEGEVVSLQARKTPLVIAGNPYDWDIYDLRTNKMVANILGGDRHDKPLYEIRINSNGMTRSTRMLPTYVLKAGPNNNPPYKAYELEAPSEVDKIEKSPGPGGTTKLKPDTMDVFMHMATQTAKGRYYGYNLILVEEGLDQYEIIEKALGAKIMEIDDAMELGYTDWNEDDGSGYPILYLGNQQNEGYSAGAVGGVGLGEELNEYGEYDTRRIIQFSKDNPPDLDYLYQQFVQRMLNPENTVDPNEWISKVNEYYGLNYSWKDYQTRGRNDHTNNWQRIINRYVVNRK
jgi:hypothetical protein